MGAVRETCGSRGRTIGLSSGHVGDVLGVVWVLYRALGRFIVAVAGVPGASCKSRLPT